MPREQFSRTFAANALKAPMGYECDNEMVPQGPKTSAAVEVIDVQPTEGFARRPLGFLLQRCASCGRTMMLGDGDTLYGERWFHGVCWSLEAEGKR
jgi:hypothetical protein